MSIRLRVDEGKTRQPQLQWDSIWQPTRGAADWAIADRDELDNQGGLRAKAALHTAVVICLMTDRRCPPDHPLSYLVEGDRRGWFGDGVDVDQSYGETDMGSLLWVFVRAPLTEQIRKAVEAEAHQCLQTLIAQGAVVSIDVQAVAHFTLNRLDLFIQLYGRDGAKIYDMKFMDLWAQTATAPKPKPFPPLEEVFIPGLEHPIPPGGMMMEDGWVEMLEDDNYLLGEYA